MRMCYGLCGVCEWEGCGVTSSVAMFPSPHLLSLATQEQVRVHCQIVQVITHNGIHVAAAKGQFLLDVPEEG